MADSASSSSSTASSKCSSDAEMMVKPKRAKVSKHGKVSERHKHKMKLRSSKYKHGHKRQLGKHHWHYSSSDSECGHKKSSKKRKDPQIRKRRHAHLPSSGTSSEGEEKIDASADRGSVSCDESSSESSSRSIPKHCKPSVKYTKKVKLSSKTTSTSARNRHLKAVFRKHFADLMLKIGDPEELAAQLYSDALISSATLNKIITLPSSQQKKNLLLLEDLDRKIRADPEKLYVFIHVIQGDPSLEDIARQISGEANEATIEEEREQTAASPKHTSNTGAGIGTRNVAKESISTKQEKHHSLKDVDYHDYTSLPCQLPPFSSAIAKYRHYLKSVYEARPTPMDDKLFINPCAQYINLAIVKKEQLSHEEADDFTRATLHGGIDQIFQKKEKVCLEEIFVTEDDCESPLKCILVEGPPGIGKSTFAWELCRKWDTLEVMQKYLLVVLFKLREKRVQNAKHLFELFCHPSDPTLSQTVVGEIIEGEHVLLILDGFDEFPASLLDEDNCLVRQIINGSCLPKATVVVTSRPSAKASFATCQCKVSKHIEIIGFTEEDRVKYAQSAFTSQPDILVHFLKYSFSNPTIKAMMYIPLNCAIVTQIYKNCMCGGGGGKKLIPRTMTQLYTALCHSLLRRYLVENSLVNRDYRMPQELNNLPQDVCKHLQTLSKVAFDGIEKQKLVFYKHELPKGFQHLGFMNECRELYVDRGVESSYNFLHLSLQEYLAAWYISQLPDIEQKVFFLNKKDGHEFLDVPMVMRFQAGIIGSGTSVVKKFLAGITGFRSAVWQDILQHETGELTVSRLMCICLYETQNCMLCQQLLSSSAIKIRSFSISLGALPTNFLTSVDFYTLGYCIAHSRGTWIIKAMAESGAEALEMLVNGLKNEPKYHLKTGSIHSFDVSHTDLSVGVAWLKELPQSILSYLSKLTLVSCRLCPKSCELLAQAISMMPNLHSLDIGQNRNIGPGGAVPLLESLCSLKQLECLKVTKTNIGPLDAKALIKFIAVSNSLQILHVSNPIRLLRLKTAKLQSAETMTHSHKVFGFPMDSILKDIIPTVLAIGTIKELELSQVTIADMVKLSSLLPSNSSITTLSLGGLSLDGLAYPTPALYVYTNESLSSLNTTIPYRNQGYSNLSKEEIIVLLNDALQHNIHCKHLKLSMEFHFPCIHDLAYRLRRGPTGPQYKFKRSHSLPCLKLKPTVPSDYQLLYLGHKHGMKMAKRVLGSNPLLRRCSSSLDLALTESISSLHPALTDSLHISGFYYGNPANN